MKTSKFGTINLTGTRTLEGINSPNEEVEMKLTDEVKKAAPEEASALPSTPTPDPAVEAITPPATDGTVPAVPAGTAAETTAGH